MNERGELVLDQALTKIARWLASRGVRRFPRILAWYIGEAVRDAYRAGELAAVQRGARSLSPHDEITAVKPAVRPKNLL